MYPHLLTPLRRIRIAIFNMCYFHFFTIAESPIVFCPLKLSSGLFFSLVYMKLFIAANRNDFIFWGIERDVPIYYKMIRKVLYTAFESIGISTEMRKKRNVTFHSWRHWYNSNMRGKIPEFKLRHLTGHKSEEMSDLYTHFRIEDFSDVLQIQEELFWRNNFACSLI